MPIYEYKCQRCGRFAQLIQKKPEAPSCCDEQMAQVVSAPAKTPERWK